MSDDLDELPLNSVTRKLWEERVDAAETAAESNHYYLALRQDDRLREVIAALREARAEIARLESQVDDLDRYRDTSL
jgi:hypothetical protein